MAQIALVKLGGSLITDKTKPFSFRGDVVLALGKEIAASHQRAILVHGGGSFGHPLAKQYRLSSGAYSRVGRGVSETRDAMYELDQLVSRALRSAGVETYPFAPFDLLRNSGVRYARAWLTKLLRAGLSPLTFGDVSSCESGFRILSGDTIMYELAKILRPARCIFAMDVDGVYGGRGGDPLETISRSQLTTLRIRKGEDATGGIRTKLDLAAKIASMGARVGLVSGFRGDEFARALTGKDFYGTVVMR